jgi:streptogramin lyase
MLRFNVVFATALTAVLSGGIFGLASCNSRPFVGDDGTPSYASGTASLSLERSGGGGTPFIKQNGKPPGWTILKVSSEEHYVALRPDPNGKVMWFADAGLHKSLVKMMMNGTTTSYALATGSGPFTPAYFTFGSDGNIYVGGCVVSACNMVGIFSPKTGSFRTIATPSGDGPGANHEFVLGPDLNVWFTEASHVGYITPQGAITEYAAPQYVGQNIIVGSNGNIWFDGQTNSSGCETSAYRGTTCPWVAQMVPSTGAVSGPYYLGIYFSSYFQAFAFLAGGMEIGPNGDVWVLAALNEGCIYGFQFHTYFDDVAPDGDQTPIKLLKRNIGQTQAALTKARNGTLWWGSNFYGNGSGLLSYDSGVETSYKNPQGSVPLVVSMGSDENVWTIDKEGDIAIYLINLLDVSPTKLTLQPKGTGLLTVTYGGTSKLTTVSANPRIATAVLTGSLQFTVTGKRAGKTQITVKDTLGNSFIVNVTVT